MPNQRVRLGVVFWVLFCGALPFLLSCESRARVAGTYRMEEGDSPAGKEVILELRENGEGAWRKGNEEIPFAWYLEAGDLRLNTKGGGVLVGKIQGETIRMTLPGGKTVSFSKRE
ncbi:MAG: hypothetical protein JXL84_07420 [Deltaproteobacteria bacterium]|nr:hypothetical protein [Deltaproteobacteria bacterium]